MLLQLKLQPTMVNIKLYIDHAYNNTGSSEFKTFLPTENKLLIASLGNIFLKHLCYFSKNSFYITTGIKKWNAVKKNRKWWHQWHSQGYKKVWMKWLDGITFCYLTCMVACMHCIHAWSLPQGKAIILIKLASESTLVSTIHSCVHWLQSFW